ncbi:hypothetical protein [Pseudarthrobacter siccitolerans]
MKSGMVRHGKALREASRHITALRRGLLRALGLASAALLMGGCSLLEPPQPPEKVTAADVSGHWHTVNGDGKRTDLELRSDGSFTWSGVPNGVLEPFASSGTLDWGNRTDHEGKWSVEPTLSGGPENLLAVRMKGKMQNGIRQFELSIEGRGSGRILYWWLGDPDNADRLKFRR